MGWLYLGGPTIQEVDGKMMMGLSIYWVAVIIGSLYSRFYGITMYPKFLINTLTTVSGIISTNCVYKSPE